MNNEKYCKINDISRKFALTNEQLLEYLFANGIEIFNENEYIDLHDEKIKGLLERLSIKEKKNHNNKSGLKYIMIEGLFGKYDYKLDFKSDIAILISENGIGKTTILNIIVAILTGDTRTLYDINFKRIKVKILDKIYIIDKQHRESFIKNNKTIEYANKKMMYLFDDLERFLPRSYFLKLRNEIMQKGYIDSSLLNELTYKLPYDEMFSNDRINRIIDTIKDIQYSGLYDEIYTIKDNLKEEVVFYPTYRRVEVAFDRVFSSVSKRYSTNELTSKYMDFGMSDVKKRIRNLLEKLRKDANEAYIEMNANIISELLTNNVSHYLNNFGNIDMHKVDVVIKRIGEDRINNIEKLRPFLKTKDLSLNNSNIEFLLYYLQKLVNIYNSQEAIDKKLSNFANVSSKYLVGKKIVYDETMLTIDVFDNDGIKVDFDNLSSGEKQIVSIFSKVYLDVTSSCIFVIDEPEISLSIEWQKNFLKDIYSSGKVALLIATTHSPFIFKNEYVDYVKELGVYKENNDVTKG